jgi:hypothetical protein
MAIKAWDIYEREGAVFRGPAGYGFASHVQRDGKWHKYTGDPRAPAVHGDLIRTEKATEEAGAALRIAAE